MDKYNSKQRLSCLLFTQIDNGRMCVFKLFRILAYREIAS
jgi:hypothetical protein